MSSHVFLPLSTLNPALPVDKVIKLWKVSERRYKLDGFNLHDEYGVQRDVQSINTLRIPHLVPVNEILVEATTKK